MNDARMQIYINKLRDDKEIPAEVYKNPLHILYHLIKYMSVEKDPTAKDKIFEALKLVKDDHDLKLIQSGHKVAEPTQHHGIRIEQERGQSSRGLNEPKFGHRK